MEEMGFDLLRLFGCYFLFKEGDISCIRRIHEPREARESRSRQFFSVCSFVSLWAFYDCKHYWYWRLMGDVISDCKPLSMFLLIWIYCIFEDQRLSMIYGSLRSRGSVVFFPSVIVYIQVFVDSLNWEDICLLNVLSYVLLLHSYQHIILFSIK